MTDSATTKRATRRAFVLVCMACVSLVLLPLAFTRGQASAALNEAQKTERALEFITQNGTTMTKIMGSNSMSKREKRFKLKSILEEHLDLQTMIRAIVGTYWRKMTPPQRARYQTSSTQWVVLYSANFLITIKPSEFEVLSVNPLGKDVMVETQTQNQGSTEPFTIHWRVRFKDDDQPALIDLHFLGLSIVAAQRGEVSSVIAENGIPVFLDKLDKRLEKIKKEFDKK